MTGKSSPEKIVRKPILQTPTRHTPRRVVTPKSVRIQSEVASDLTAPDSHPSPIRTPVMVHGGARPKTPIMENTLLAPPIVSPSHSQTQPSIPRRILSSTPSGEGIDKRSRAIRNIDKKRKILEEQNRKIFHPPPIEGIDIGVTEGLETLEPEIRIPTEEDFVLPPPLDARSFCLYLGGVGFWVFLISFSIVPEVPITLVVHKYISCDFGECCESVP